MNKATAARHSGNTDLPLWLRVSFLAEAEARTSHKFPDDSVYHPETPEAWFEVGELERRLGKWDRERVGIKPLRNDEVKRAIKTAVEKGFLWDDSEETCLKPVRI